MHPDQRLRLMTQLGPKDSEADVTRSKRSWLTVSAVFVLTWLTFAVGLTVLAPPLPPPVSGATQVPTAAGSVTQKQNSSASTGFRTRGLTRAESGNTQELALREELRQAPEKGLLEHDIPSQLTLFEEQHVYVRLSRGPAAEEFIQGLRSKPEVVPVRDFVSLTLFGDNDFDVERLSPDPQSMRQNNFCLWKFRVTPKRGGKHTLEIQVNLYDTYGYVPVASYSREVEVHVPFQSGVALMWEDYSGSWVLTYLLLPLAASVFSAWMTARMTVQVQPGPSKKAKISSKSRTSIKKKTGSRFA